MKNVEILRLYDALEAISGEDSKELSIQAKFKMAKNKMKLTELRNVIMDQRASIIARYGETQEDGSIKVPSNKYDITSHEIDQLLEIETHCDVEKLTLDELEGARIDVDTMMKLMPMIEETHDE